VILHPADVFLIRPVRERCGIRKTRGIAMIAITTNSSLKVKA